jgi:hypothetical protein
MVLQSLFRMGPFAVCQLLMLIPIPLSLAKMFALVAREGKDNGLHEGSSWRGPISHTFVAQLSDLLLAYLFE